jgi:phosphoribosylaminoimidazole-succinocarboxamide synthase
MDSGQNKVLLATDYQFEAQTGSYKGKVRETYSINDDLLIAIVTDRLSAFDVVMPKGIPFKGQVLNQIASQMLKDTSDIVPNWMIATPDPNVTVGHKCEPFKIEMVIRGYLSGHAAREYKKGTRELCGVTMPEGMKENDAFPEPIITPATKAEQGDHDEDISRTQILERGIVKPEEYEQLEQYTRRLFKRGSELAAARGLILVDTKYEFGKSVDGTIMLIDEIHTPDSSRYFYADGYEERQKEGSSQKQLSKEFVRQWLISQDFQGRDGDVLPEMDDEMVNQISNRYVELYESITGLEFKPRVVSENLSLHDQIKQNVSDWLSDYNS